jgi:hypothetical protein
MRLITGLDDSPSQIISITTETGLTFDLLLNYSVNRQSWFWSVTYNDFGVNGCQLTIGENILHRYKHALPFGLACLTDDSILVNPFRIDDFSTGRIKLYSLSQSDVDSIEKAIYG